MPKHLRDSHHDKEVPLYAFPVELGDSVALANVAVHGPLVRVAAAAASLAGLVLELHSHLCRVTARLWLPVES